MMRFTKEEKLVILFLLAMLFLGSGVLYYKKINPAPMHFVEFDESKILEAAKINLNSANKEKLMKLKHIGPVLAERIISYRETSGPFADKEDVKNVKGVGDKTYEDIRKYITVE